MKKSDVSRAYAPVALYYEEADSLEYIRRDVPCVYRRIDNFLTLALDMDSRDPLGFRLKGFKNFYLRTLKSKHNLSDKHFILIINVLSEAMSNLGNEMFERNERKKAYEEALNIAGEDEVKILSPSFSNI